MADTVKGSELVPGQVFKDSGRWYTLVGIADNAITHLRPFRDGYFAEVTSSTGETRWVPVYNKDAYALKSGKPGPLVLNITDFDGKRDETGSLPVVSLAVRIRHDRKMGRHNVCRDDNGRKLGWLTRQPDGTWDARTGDSPFQGDSAGDLGDILDEVPPHLSRRGWSGQPGCDAVVRGCRTREDAAEALFSYLRSHHAPAVGYGRHYDVRRYETFERSHAS